MAEAEAEKKVTEAEKKVTVAEADKKVAEATADKKVAEAEDAGRSRLVGVICLFGCVIDGISIYSGSRLYY